LVYEALMLSKGYTIARAI